MEFKGIVRFPCFTASRRKGISKTLLIMKLTSLILLMACLEVGATGYSQKLTVSVHEAPLEKVFSQIEKQSGYRFWYDQLLVKGASKVTIDLREVSLEEALNQLLRDLDLTYTIVRKTIVIKRKPGISPAPILPGDTTHRPAQIPIKPKGVIYNETGDPLIGATVKVNGANILTYTNTKGEFELPEVPAGSVLTITFVGYAPRKVILKTADPLKVSLLIAANPLDEKIVQGYGTTSPRFNTGDISRVDAATLEKMPVNDPILELQGRVPGLQITPTSGLPGSEVNVQIRGVNSLNRDANNIGTIDRSNSPLYIVDGVPFVSSPLNVDGVGSNMGVYNPASQALIFSSPFKSIDPSQIESISILKDADATAIYGARGANGVILITTKRPKAGNTSFTADVYTGVGKVPKFINMLNTRQYLAMRREAFKNDGTSPSPDPNNFLNYAPDLTVWDTTAYTNWVKKYAGGNATTTSAQATVSGGNDQTRFLFGVGYRDQGNVFPGDFGLQQGSFRFNVDHNSLDKKFSMNISTMYSTDINRLLSTDPFSYYNLPPDQPIYNADKSLNWTAGSNPQAAFLQTYQDRAKNLNSNVVLGYQILKGLHFRTSLGYNRIQQDQVLKVPFGSFDPSSTSLAFRSQSTNLSATYLAEPQLDYNVKIGKSTLQALIGGTYQETSTSLLFINGQGYTNDDLLDDIGSATTKYITTASTDYKYLSYFSRLNYNLKQRYILNFTGRRDGSSRFGPGRRFGNFGAIGAAWIFSEESLIKDNVSFLSFGKLRGSYGITGNDKIGDYQYYNTYQANSNAPYQTIGYISNKLYNPDYQWETNKKLEGAIELGFFKDRILLTADYYNNRTGNSLVNYSLPSQTGFSGVTANLNARIQNSGLEFALTTVNIKNQDFTWSTNFNISFQRNKLLSFPGLSESPYRNLYSIGQSISNLHGFVYDGVDPATGAAKLKDLNKNGIFNEFYTQGDQTIIANTLPDYYGGISNTFIYKNWQLDVFFTFRRLDKVLYNVNLAPGTMANIDHSTGARWQNPGDITNTPRYVTSFLLSNFTVNQAYLQYLYLGQSNYGLRNGSYLRLSNAALSYTLPAGVLKHVHVKSLRLYVLAQNLFTITQFPGPDPETGLSMPSLRTVTGGLKINL